MPADLKEIFSDNFKYYRNLKNVSMNELAEAIKVSQSTISDWENGNKMPRSGSIQKLADYFRIDKIDLLVDRNNKIPSNLIPATNIVKIPILGEIACGEPILAEENVEGYLEEIADILPDGELFYLRCKGDSMEPTIKNGSYALIRQQPEVEDGEIAAVLVNGNTEVTLKRVKHQGNIVMLMPDNPEYSPYIITEDNPARIIGRALEVKFKL